MLRVPKSPDGASARIFPNPHLTFTNESILPAANAR